MGRGIEEPAFPRMLEMSERALEVGSVGLLRTLVSEAIAPGCVAVGRLEAASPMMLEINERALEVGSVGLLRMLVNEAIAPSSG